MTTIWSGYQASQRLSEMDLELSDFRLAGEAAHATFTNRSPNDAPFFPVWSRRLTTCVSIQMCLEPTSPRIHLSPSGATVGLFGVCGCTPDSLAAASAPSLLSKSVRS